MACFNKKVACEYCNRKYNITYLSKHKKVCPVAAGSVLHPEGTGGTVGTEGTEGTSHRRHSEAPPVSFLHAALPPSGAEGFQSTGGQQSCNAEEAVLKTNRTLIVGPSFCGKTYLLLNKLKLFRLCDSEKQIKIITKTPKQYNEAALLKQGFDEEDLEHISVEKDIGDVEDYENCCIVFDDMLDSNQKLIEPFFTRGRHKDLDVCYLSQSFFRVDRTVRMNSNIIILFQQTLKDIIHIYGDVAAFDMSYDEFKSLCREAWKEEYNYLEINKFEKKMEKNIKFVMNLI